MIVDEIGIPLASTSVTVDVAGVVSSQTTDGSGVLTFCVASGTSVKVQVIDTHEGKGGESTVTPSGHHFKANGTGP